MIVNSELHRAIVALCDAAQPIMEHRSDEPDEYVVPRPELEAVQAALCALHHKKQQEHSHDQ